MDPLSPAVEWAEELTWGVVQLSLALDAPGRAALLLELATAVEEGAVRAPLPGRTVRSPPGRNRSACGW